MSNLISVLNQLEKERTRLASQLANLNSALAALNVNGASRKGKVSAAGRARIAAAQRARWAKVKGRKVVSITTRKRTMSPAARKRIIAAQKARWAKWRKARKTG
jgi:peptidoglycan hydrolase CwlO-like protein